MQLEIPKIHDEAQRAAIETAISACVQRFYAKGMADPCSDPSSPARSPTFPVT